jgi:hypothetical protein
MIVLLEKRGFLGRRTCRGYRTDERERVVVDHQVDGNDVVEQRENISNVRVIIHEISKGRVVTSMTLFEYMISSIRTCQLVVALKRTEYGPCIVLLYRLEYSRR